VRKRTSKLQTYLSTVLERLPTDLEKVNHDSACKLLRHFLLMQPSTATEDVLLKIQTDTECLESHHRPEFEQDYLMSKLLRKNPFDHRSDVTILLNEYLIKVVQNDSRKNGISDQIKTFIRQVQQDNEKGSVRDIVRRVLMNSGNVGGNGRGSGSSKSLVRANSLPRFRSSKSLLSLSDAKVLDRAIAIQEKRKNSSVTLDDSINMIEAKIYSSRLEKILHFAENLFFLLMEEHFLVLMSLLPLTNAQLSQRDRQVKEKEKHEETEEKGGWRH
jgi:hypothetical protein